jgi:hypothetical protein
VKNLYNKETYDLYSSTNAIWVTKSRGMRKVGHSAQMRDRRCANGFWWKNLGEEDLGPYGLITLK